jgi:hypothetical protein
LACIPKSIDTLKTSTGVLFSGIKVPFLASESGSLQIYTNQSSSLLHFAVRKKNLDVHHETTFESLISTKCLDDGGFGYKTVISIGKGTTLSRLHFILPLT